MKPIVLYALKPVLYNILVLTTLFEKRAGSKKFLRKIGPTRFRRDREFPGFFQVVADLI